MLRWINALPSLPIAALILAVGLVFAAYVWSPVRQAQDSVGEPLAQAIGLINGHCPDGWKATDRRDEHVRVEYCDRGDWRVYVHEDGTVSHGCPLLSGVCVARFVFPENDRLEVPGWPQ